VTFRTSTPWCTQDRSRDRCVAGDSSLRDNRISKEVPDENQEIGRSILGVAETESLSLTTVLSIGEIPLFPSLITYESRAVPGVLPITLTAGEPIVVFIQEILAQLQVWLYDQTGEVIVNVFFSRHIISSEFYRQSRS
jgi:hypothetical protein